MSTEEVERPKIGRSRTVVYLYFGFIALLIGALGSGITIWQMNVQKDAAQQNTITQASITSQSQICHENPEEALCVFAKEILANPTEPIPGPEGPQGPKGDKGEPGKDATVDIADFVCVEDDLKLELSNGSIATAPEACAVADVTN